MAGITPSQTVGPFFAYGLTPNGEYAWNDAFTTHLVTPDTSGDRIRIEGTVYDGDGVPVPDAMLEIWQADAQGRFADPQDKRALPNASFSYSVATSGGVTYAADGTPAADSWTIALPNALITVAVANGTATIAIDDGKDGTIDRSFTIPVAQLTADAG